MLSQAALLDNAQIFLIRQFNRDCCCVFSLTAVSWNINQQVRTHFRLTLMHEKHLPLSDIVNTTLQVVQSKRCHRFFWFLNTLQSQACAGLLTLAFFMLHCFSMVVAFYGMDKKLWKLPAAVAGLHYVAALTVSSFPWHLLWELLIEKRPLQLHENIYRDHTSSSAIV